MLKEINPEAALVINLKVLNILASESSQDLLAQLNEVCGSESAVYNQLALVLKNPFIACALLRNSSLDVQVKYRQVKADFPAIYRKEKILPAWQGEN